MLHLVKVQNIYFILETRGVKKPRVPSADRAALPRTFRKKHGFGTAPPAIGARFSTMA